MMIKAVLLDLDNTLLKNPDENFARAYLGLADQFFEERWNLSEFSHLLLQGIQSVVTSHDPTRTNANVLLDLISNATGQSEPEIRATFSDFYNTAYPTLSKCTEISPFAPHLVAALRESNYAIIIATNPIYPPEAVRQRLAWAGLPDSLDNYALVTHADNMHFAKPDPAYYIEAVARVGVEPDEAIMVGDNLQNDMIPARLAGLCTFHIRETADETGMAGNLESFYQHVMSGNWLDLLAPGPLKPEMIEPELRGNVGALFGTLSDVKPHYWLQHPDPDEWSLIQTVCHLLESETKVQRWRLQKIRAETNPFLSNPLPPPGPREAIPCDESGWSGAYRFAEERKKTIDWLSTLQPEDWTRPARHSVFGPTNLLEMAHFTAQHDRLHINQICQTLGKCV